MSVFAALTVFERMEKRMKEMRRIGMSARCILLALGIVLLVSLFGCSRNNDEISQQELDAAFAQASDLNSNSELPYDYLMSFERYCRDEFISSGGIEADWEYIDWENIDAGNDHPYTISTGGLDFGGYFFPFPHREEHEAEYLYLTQIVIESTDYHVYSVSVGSVAEAAAEILAAKGFVRTERVEEGYCFEKNRVIIVLDTDSENTVTRIRILTDT